MKKKVFSSFILGLFFMDLSSFAQVGIGTSSPSASAKLEISSSSQGFLPPRMTTSDRDNIANPATGLVIFNTTTNGLEIRTSSSWVRLLTPTDNATNVTGVVAVANGGTGVVTSTGTGSVVLSNSPSLVTPSLGSATASKLGVGIVTPNNSALVEMSSTSQGFLPPRLTYSQRNAIASPAQGLIIYCTTCGNNGELQVYNGTAWTNMVGGTASAITIGASDFGGKVAYIFQSGDPGYVAGETHGIIASIDEWTARWGCPGTTISGSNGTGLGTGSQNTIDIIAGCTSAGIAAQLCADYSVTTGGITYSDWHLPSITELQRILANRASIGGFNSPYILYWSSSQNGSTQAYVIRTDNPGTDYVTHKSGGDYGIGTRAVRFF